MFIDKKNNNYYVKYNGKVLNVTKDEYIAFRKKLKEQGICEICISCNNKECDKQLHMNINKSEGVNIATYIINEDVIIHKNGEETKRHFVLNFDVFNCDLYKNYINDEGKKLKYIKNNEN